MVTCFLPDNSWRNGDVLGTRRSNAPSAAVIEKESSFLWYFPAIAPGEPEELF
jgi:hypothetical protein